MKFKAILFFAFFSMLLFWGCRKETYNANRIEGLWKLIEYTDTSGTLNEAELRPAYYEFYNCKTARKKTCLGILLLKDTVFGDFTLNFTWGVVDHNKITITVKGPKVYSLNGELDLDGVARYKRLKIVKDSKTSFVLRREKTVETSY